MEISGDGMSGSVDCFEGSLIEDDERAFTWEKVEGSEGEIDSGGEVHASEIEGCQYVGQVQELSSTTVDANRITIEVVEVEALNGADADLVCQPVGSELSVVVGDSGADVGDVVVIRLSHTTPTNQ